MDKPKVKESGFKPKVLTKAAIMPREAKNMLISQYRAHQKKPFENQSDEQNANDYAQDKMTDTAKGGAEYVFGAAKQSLKSLPKTRDIVQRIKAKQEAVAAQEATQGADTTGAVQAADTTQSNPGNVRESSVSRQSGDTRFSSSLQNSVDVGSYTLRNDLPAADVPPRPSARTSADAGRDLQIQRFAEKRREAETTRQAGDTRFSDSPQSSASAGDYTLRKNSASSAADVPPRPLARPSADAGRDLQIQRFTEKRREANAAKQAGRDTVQRLQTGQGTSRAANQAAQFGKTAGKSGEAAKKGGGAVKQGSKSAVKTVDKTAKTAKKTVKTARNAAKQAAQTTQKTKKAIIAAKKMIKAVVKVIKAVVKTVLNALIAIIASGGGIVIVLLLLIILIAGIIASPFGIFFSANDSDPGIKPLTQIVSETNAELTQKIEQIKLNHSYVDEIALNFDGSETNTAVNNWVDIIAVFAVKTSLADGENAADVVTLDADKEARLKAVFWDMTPVDSWVEEQIRTREVVTIDADGNEVIGIEFYSYYILHIVVDSLSYSEGADLYSFNADERAILYELMEADNYLLLLSLLGMEYTGHTITPEELQALLASLQGLNADRESFITAALSLVGRVNYFWGGKSGAVGWDTRWGTPTEVTAAGSRTTGTIRPYGLDCTGYLGWCFTQIGVTGWHSGYTQWDYSTAATWDEAEPGDIVFFSVPGTVKTNHAGIIVGFNADGKPLVAHCNSGQNNVTVDVASASFRFVRKPVIFTN